MHRLAIRSGLGVFLLMLGTSLLFAQPKSMGATPLTETDRLLQNTIQQIQETERQMTTMQQTLTSIQSRIAVLKNLGRVAESTSSPALFWNKIRATQPDVLQKNPTELAYVVQKNWNLTSGKLNTTLKAFGMKADVLQTAMSGYDRLQERLSAQEILDTMDLQALVNRRGQLMALGSNLAQKTGRDLEKLLKP